MTDRIEMLDRSIAALERTLERTSRIAAEDIGDNHMRLRIVEDRLSSLSERVAALERATCTESEPNSEDAPMTPEQEWADVGLDEWEYWPADCTTVRYRRVRSDGSTAFIVHTSSAPWRVLWFRAGGSQCHEAATLRDALATAREHAPADLRRYLYPRDEWRTFEECEPEHASMIQIKGVGPFHRYMISPPCSSKCRWRPASPPNDPEIPDSSPEQEAERDEVADLRARIAEVEAERDRAADEERDRIVSWLRDRAVCALVVDRTLLEYANRIERGEHRGEA